MSTTVSTNMWSRSIAAVGAIGLLAVVVTIRAALPEQDASSRGTGNVDFASVPQRLHFPTIAIRRNPFVASSRDIEGPGNADLDEGDIVLPPNAGAPAPVLRAVIFGSVPKALVELAGRTAIVGVGSRLANSTVVAIMPGALLFENGARLILPRSQP